MNLTHEEILWIRAEKRRAEYRQQQAEKKATFAATLATILIVLLTILFVIGSMPLIISNHKAVPLWVW